MYRKQHDDIILPKFLQLLASRSRESEQEPEPEPWIIFRVSWSQSVSGFWSPVQGDRRRQKILQLQELQEKSHCTHQATTGKYLRNILIYNVIWNW